MICAKFLAVRIKRGYPVHVIIESKSVQFITQFFTCLSITGNHYPVFIYNKTREAYNEHKRNPELINTITLRGAEMMLSVQEIVNTQIERIVKRNKEIQNTITRAVFVQVEMKLGECDLKRFGEISEDFLKVLPSEKNIIFEGVKLEGTKSFIYETEDINSRNAETRISEDKETRRDSVIVRDNGDNNKNTFNSVTISKECPLCKERKYEEAHFTCGHTGCSFCFIPELPCWKCVFTEKSIVYENKEVVNCFRCKTNGICKQLICGDYICENCIKVIDMAKFNYFCSECCISKAKKCISCKKDSRWEISGNYLNKKCCDEEYCRYCLKKYSLLKTCCKFNKHYLLE